MMAEDVTMSIEYLAKISFKDLTEFVSDRVKNHACPACNTNDWSLVGDEDHIIVIVGVKKGEDFSLPPPGIPVTAINCKSCGYVRFHSLAVISKWKYEREHGSTEN